MKNKGNGNKEGCTPKKVQVTPGAWVTKSLPKVMK